MKRLLLLTCWLPVTISCGEVTTQGQPTLTPALECELDEAPTFEGDIQFTPDGGHVLVGTVKGFHVVDRERGSKKSIFPKKGSVDNVAVTPDGKAAVYTSYDEAAIWELTAGKKVSSHVAAEDGTFSGVHVAKDGDRITLLVRRGGELLHWDRKSGEKTAVFELGDSALVPIGPFDNTAYCLAVHDDTLAVISVRPGFLVFDLEHGRETRFVTVGDGAAVTGMAFSLDGKILAVSQGLYVWLFDTNTWDSPTRGSINRRGETARGLEFAPDGKTLYVATVSGNCRPAGVTLFDPKSGRNLGYFQTHPEWSASLDVSPDGKYLATASIDGLKVWELDRVHAALLKSQE